MQLEYFQLIDRIVDLNVGEKTITVEAQVPQHSTIFEGHFPGYPIMPGVLLIEAMAQTSGWLLLALTKFERMPFLAAVKEAKMRGFVTPGELLTIDASIVHEGSGYAITEAKVRVGGKLRCNATITFSHDPLPQSGFARAHGRRWPSVSAFRNRPSPMTETKSSNPGPAEVWITGIGLATSLGEGLDAQLGRAQRSGASTSTKRASRPTSCIPGRR